MEKIKLLRAKIDNLDMGILSLLAERRKTALQIGKIKARLSCSITDKKRESEALEMRLLKGKDLNIPVRLLTGLFRLIFSDSRNIQRKPFHVLTKQAKIDKIYR
jgi:chorismate mutase / prephenate dehydratase